MGSCSTRWVRWDGQLFNALGETEWAAGETPVRHRRGGMPWQGQGRAVESTAARDKHAECLLHLGHCYELFLQLLPQQFWY